MHTESPYSSKLMVILLASMMVFGSSSLPSHAQVSTDYEANYGLNQTWENIMTNFITIQATRRRGEQVPASVFASLHTDFTSIFPRLPQRNNYRIIYDTCLAQTQSLAQAYTPI